MLTKTQPQDDSMVSIVVLLFVVLINFINFFKYLSKTQLLIVILLEILKDLGATMFIAIVNIVALTFSFYGIELFKLSLINWNEVSQLDGNIETGTLSFYQLLLDTISLAFLGDGNSIENLFNLVSLLDNPDIVNFPDLKKSIEKLSI